MVVLPISTTFLNVKYLEQLVRKGQKGKTANEAAERVLCDHIVQLLRSGELKPIEPTTDDLTPIVEEDSDQ